VERRALSCLSIVDYRKTWNDCQYRIAAGSLLGTVKVAPHPLVNCTITFAANVLDWKFFVAYACLKKLEGKTGYAIEFSGAGFNCFGGPFPVVKFRYAPARRASFSSVVAGHSYHRGSLFAGETRGEVNHKTTQPGHLSS
jgi:hypothetical protein